MIRIIINTAMQVERQKHQGIGLYEYECARCLLPGAARGSPAGDPEVQAGGVFP